MPSLLLLATLLSPAAAVHAAAVHAAVVPAAAVTAATPPASLASAATADARIAFGTSVALSGDWAFVGEPRGASGGLVHVYQRGTAGWRAVTTLRAPDAAANDGYGAAVATDGRTLLVTRQSAAASPDGGRGTVFAYQRAATGAWEGIGSWTADDPLPRAQFGAALLVRGDLALVGAPLHETGKVFVFRRSGAGAWAPAGRIVPTDATDGDLFGAALAMDGDRVAIGAPGRSAGKGAVFVFAQNAGGGFTPQAMAVAAAGTDNANLGASVALAGRRLVAGAPGAFPIAGRRGASMGQVTLFEYSTVAEIWRERQSFVPFQAGMSRFGASVAIAGDEVWVGAPASQFNTGHLYRLQPEPDGSWGGMRTLQVAEVEPGASFGAAMAVAGDAAAIGMPTDGGGEGSVMFLARSAAGAWTSRGVVFPAANARTFAAVTGTEVMCGADGRTGDFECGNTSLLSFLPISAIGGKRGTRMNDNWGWTDPETGREIAILGRTDGTSFVDITDPLNPRYLGDLPKTKGSPSAAWRDMKVYKDHAFIVADNSGEHGMQVFDLTRLRAVRTPQVFTPDLTYDRINSAHNIVANEETGFMYIVGGSAGGETCGGGHHAVDVREPKQPKFAGCFGDARTGRAGTGYSHDSQCLVYRGPDKRYEGREICIGSNETAISIADVTDKQNVVYLSRAAYPNVAYAHQAWLTEDHKFLYLNDEGDESAGQGEAAKGTRTLVWDVQDLTDPVLVKEHIGTSKAIDHNLYVKGDRMYQANYTAGLRILDVSDPANPKEVGFLDTHPGDDGSPSFQGAWSVYPFFKSGAIVVTSIGEGVFFVKDRTRPVVQ
jgi:choice-of-anchor B domain-containing protein